MSFTYSGDNNFIDRITNEGTAFQIFKNQNPVYYNGVAYDAGTFQTIGISHEFGGLDDGVLPSTRQNLMIEYLTFFGIQIPALTANFAGYPTIITVGENVDFFDFSTGAIIGREWEFPGGEPASSTEENPVVFYNTAGTYDVTLTVTDGTGATNTLTRTNYITVDNITGIPAPASGLGCLVLPNPSNGTFTVKFTSETEETINLKIFNPVGTMVYAENGLTVKGSVQKTVALNQAPDGLYILTIQGQHRAVTRKIIIVGQ